MATNVQGNKVFLSLGAKANVEIITKGAHVTQWKDEVGKEQLYVSPDTSFASGTAIRGGIPVIFPQFANKGPLPSHGFARKSENWVVQETGSNEDAAWVVFVLRENEETKKLWNGNRFELAYRITLFDQGNQLQCEARIRNMNSTNSKPVAVQICFHTYFAVHSDISYTSIGGLQGAWYVDKVKGNVEIQESGERVEIREEVDRVYRNVQGNIFISDNKTQKKLLIEKKNLPDVVVWNPWIEKSKSMKDLPNEDYHSFVCVETGAITSPCIIPSQTNVEVVQTLHAAKL